MDVLPCFASQSGYSQLQLNSAWIA